MKKYSYARYQDKLLGDAQDAFQNGLEKFLTKTQKKESKRKLNLGLLHQNKFKVRTNLKTTIYRYGFFQLMDYFGGDKLTYGLDQNFEFLKAFAEDAEFATERQEILDDVEIMLVDALTDETTYDMGTIPASLDKDLKKLPKKNQDVLKMRFYENMTTIEIARKLKLSPDYVNNVSSKSYKLLHEMLKKRYFDF